MCGKASPFRDQLSINPGGFASRFQEGGIAFDDEDDVPGKAEPFRTSSGRAVREKSKQQKKLNRRERTPLNSRD
jgi:hypothetical protein